jgi:UDP-glucose 4-epimerase
MALDGEPLQIYGTGEQTRCFCYVGDVVEAIIRLMNSEAAAGKVFNVGTNEEISIEALADKIIELTGSKSEKQFVPYETAFGKPIEDMMRRVPSVERIREAVGWESGTKLDQTLEIIVESFRRNQDAAS